MRKKVIAITCLVTLAVLLFTGCSNDLEEQNNALAQEVSQLKAKNESLENTIKELNNEIELQKMSISDLSRPVFGSSKNIYPIYTADIVTLEIKKNLYTYIPEKASQKQKLDMLAKALSEGYFQNLPIEVMGIEEVDGKKIAIVNLKEAAVNQGKTKPEEFTGLSWTFQALQGSTGGTVSETRLIETMLQREYQGQWVDAVKFLYQGKTCDYEHAASLKDVNYRIK